MAKLILILLIGLVCEAIGVVFLSKGMKEIGDLARLSVSEVLRVLRLGATNPHLLLGIFFEALFFATLLILLARGDVSFIWPLTSLSFVLTAISARLFLHEDVSPARWTGIVLIVAGAALITWSEKQKRRSEIPAAVEAIARVGSGSPPVQH